jgi:hypothetical protein
MQFYISRINSVLNIPNYENNHRKILIYFSNIRYRALYLVIIFELKTQPADGEINRTTLTRR